MSDFLVRGSIAELDADIAELLSYTDVPTTRQGMLENAEGAYSVLSQFMEASHA